MQNLRRTIIIAASIAMSIAMLVAIPSCSKQEPDQRPVCFVGGTMYPAMQELASMFEKQTGYEIRLDKAGSGELMIRIEKQMGRNSEDNADLYICHDPYLGKLFAKGLGSEGWTVAGITPVIVVRPGNPKQIKSLADLTRKDLRIVLTDFHHTTLGWMLPTLFDKVGVDFKKQILPLKSIETHRSGGVAATKVANNARDLAVVWNAVGHLQKPKVDIVEISPEHLPTPGVKADLVTSATTGKIYNISLIRVTIATIKHPKPSKRSTVARQFALFVASDQGQKVWARFGFTIVPVKKKY